MTKSRCDNTSPHQGPFSFPRGTRTWLGGHDFAARREVHDHLKGIIELVSGPIDVGIITPLTASEAVYFAEKIVGRLPHQGSIWISGFPSPNTQEGGGSNSLAELIRAMNDAGFKAIDPFTLSSTCSLLEFQFRSDAIDHRL